MGTKKHEFETKCFSGTKRKIASLDALLIRVIRVIRVKMSELETTYGDIHLCLVEAKIYDPLR